MFVDSYIFLELPDYHNSCVKVTRKPNGLIVKSQSNSESWLENSDALEMFCGPFTSSL